MDMYVLAVAVTLPEPTLKLRDGEAKEDAKLTDFQQELVQMAATLNGDYKKDIYPHKLVEEMTVAEGAKYVEDAFKKFRGQCEKAEAEGVDGSQIVVVPTPTTKQRKSKSFGRKLLSCLACNN